MEGGWGVHFAFGGTFISIETIGPIRPPSEYPVLSAACGVRRMGAEYRISDAVEVFSDRQQSWISSTVRAISSDGLITVRYDDGVHVKHVVPSRVDSHLRLLRRAAVASVDLQQRYDMLAARAARAAVATDAAVTRAVAAVAAADPAGDDNDAMLVPKDAFASPSHVEQRTASPIDVHATVLTSTDPYGPSSADANTIVATPVVDDLPMVARRIGRPPPPFGEVGCGGVMMFTAL